MLVYVPNTRLALSAALFSGLLVFSLNAIAIPFDPIDLIPFSGSTQISSTETKSFQLSNQCQTFLTLVKDQPMSRLRPVTDPNLTLSQQNALFAGKNADLRALSIQASLSEFMLRSRQLAKILENAPADEPSSRFYDIVFIGAGPAETTAQLAIQRSGSSLKTLTIEADEVIARTFSETRGFYLNSTDGPSMSDERPLPNRGLNLNKIPNGVIQTSVIQTAKYPEAGELGDIINLNRLQIPQPILFNQMVESYSPTSQQLQRMGFPEFTIKMKSGLYVYAETVIESSGLGVEKSTASSDKSQELVAREWQRFMDGGTTPRYFTSTRFFNFITAAREPYLPFKDKKIVVIGDGDFAKVVWEFLERQGPPSAYKNDTVEIGRYGQGIWLAKDIESSCQSFINTSRARYLRGIPSALQKGRIKPINGRSMDVELGSNGRPVVRYLDNGGREQTLEADVIIDAIGFTRKNLGTAETKDVRANLPETGDAVVARETFPGAYRVGTAADVPVTKAELANVEDNRVSLYLNLVRVESLIKKVLNDYAEAYGKFPALPSTPLTPVGSGNGEFIRINMVNPNGFLQDRAFAREFLDAAVSSALSELNLPAQSQGSLRIFSSLVNGQPVFEIGDLNVNGNPAGRAALSALVDALSVTPAFFSLLAETVNNGDDTESSWNFSKSRNEVVPQVDSQMRRLRVSRSNDVIEERILRGFRMPLDLAYQQRPTPTPPPIPRQSPAPRTDNFTRNSPACFTAAMKVSTPWGDRPISSLKVGDEVLSLDTATGQVVSNRIVKMSNVVREYGVLEDQRFKLEVTPRHKLYNPSLNDYVAVEDMKNGDPVLRTVTPTLRNGPPILESVPRGCYLPSGKEAPVFNLDLEKEPHNFFVEGILVHNGIKVIIF